MTRDHTRRWRAAFRCRAGLARALLVLYVVAVHGLPALHLVWHRNDHVHVLGGLRWLPELAPHTHAGDGSDRPPPLLKAPTAGTRQRLVSADGAAPPPAAPHLAVGPSHGQQALILWAAAPALGPAAACGALRPSLPGLRERALVRGPRARAPPVPV